MHGQSNDVREFVWENPLHGSSPLTEFSRIIFKLCMNYIFASFASSCFALYNTLQLILLLSLLHMSERTHSHSPCCVSWWIHVFAFKNWTVLQRHKKLIKHKVYLAVLKKYVDIGLFNELMVFGWSDSLKACFKNISYLQTSLSWHRKMS